MVEIHVKKDTEIPTYEVGEWLSPAIGATVLTFLGKAWVVNTALRSGYAPPDVIKADLNDEQLNDCIVGGAPYAHWSAQCPAWARAVGPWDPVYGVTARLGPDEIEWIVDADGERGYPRVFSTVRIARVDQGRTCTPDGDWALIARLPAPSEDQLIHDARHHPGTVRACMACMLVCYCDVTRSGTRCVCCGN